MRVSGPIYVTYIVLEVAVTWIRLSMTGFHWHAGEDERQPIQMEETMTFKIDLPETIKVLQHRSPAPIIYV